MHRLLDAPFKREASRPTAVMTRLLYCSKAVALQSVRSCTGSAAQQENKGQQLLEYWQGLLGVSAAQPSVSQATQSMTALKTESIRGLLHTAIRVRQGRVSGVLPEQLLSTFIQVYQNAMGPNDRLKLFHVICDDFGVQGVHGCNAGIYLCRIAMLLRHYSNAANLLLMIAHDVQEHTWKKPYKLGRRPQVRCTCTCYASAAVCS